MARSQTRYVCQACGATAAKWLGRCEGCGAWNSLLEEADSGPAPGGLRRGGKANPITFESLDGQTKETPRLVSGIGEFDRVCGGGLVRGSAVLLGGDPGIGKSTLLLQGLAALAAKLPDGACCYVSGEESVDQVRLRAKRMGLSGSSVRLAAATNVRDIAAALDGPESPAVVVIDSIQTMHVDSLDSAPGTVSQVRASSQELIRLAKRRGFALLLIGHVTKEGVLAGPKVLEHMVDTVLAFEGERGHTFRILRAQKNRFGATDEIGVFEMSDSGMEEVENPSALFLADRRGSVSGTAVFAGMEGSRPVLMEIQALVCPSPLATPRRAVVGWDSGRLAMIIAVLEARCGLVLAGQEVYLNVVGGLRITEPAADLAVAAALASALTKEPVQEDCVVFGEIGLSGEVRPVSQHDARLREAAKLGFASAITPPQRKGKKGGKGAAKANGQDSLSVQEVTHLIDLVSRFPVNRRRDEEQRRAANA